MDRTVAHAVAADAVGSIPLRWQHVLAVGHRAEDLADRYSALDELLVVAAWLHDVGYAPALRRTGQHALDGASFLLTEGCPVEVVRLVAFHTGAAFEASERGLEPQLNDFEAPDQRDLDILTMIDLSVGPDGSSVLDMDRIDEILRRYSHEDPVHRAVARSKHELLASSARAKRLLGLPDDWPVVAC